MAIGQLPLIEMHSEFDKLLDTCGTLGHHRADYLFVAKSGTGDKRVANMKLKRILFTDDTGDAPLRPGSVRIRQQALGHEGHGPFSCRLERKRETRDAAADDNAIEFSHGSRG